MRYAPFIRVTDVRHVNVELNAAVRHVMLRALNSMSGSAAPDDYTFEPLHQTPNGSWVIRATAPGTDDLLYRLIRPGDLAPGIPDGLVSVEGQHVATQSSQFIDDYRVVQRPFLPQLLTARDVIREARTFGHNRSVTASRVRQFLSQTLAGLATIHNAGLVHGDLRPGKIGFLEDGTLALRDVSVRFRENFRDATTVAPEIRSAENPVYSPSTDIYSFLRVARLLLDPFRGDLDAPDLAQLDARVRWLEDYYFPRTDRPTAKALKEFFDTGRPTQLTAIDEFLDAYNQSHSLVARRGIARPGIRNLGVYLDSYPETSFAIDGSPSGRRLAGWLAIANGIEKPYSSYKQRITRRGRTRVEHMNAEFSSDSFPDQIDSLWMNSLHRMLFGFPMDSSHEERMKTLSDEDKAKRDLFLTAIEGATKARAELLAENQFLSTHEAIAALSSADVPVDRDEFMVLRRWGFILAVPDHGRTLHPAFQFRDGVVSPHVQTVHAKLRAQRDGSDPNPWSELTFWCIRRDALNGLALRDAIWQERLRRPVADVVVRALV